MTKEIETLGLVQSDSFNYQRYSTYIMDSWADLDCPATDLSRTKPRLNHDDELSAITMLYDQCKSQKEQRMTACSRGSSMHKPTERTLTNSSPEVVSMETPVNIMKLLSESISSSHAHQDGLPPLCPASKPSAPLPPPSETYATLAPSAASADSYDKLVINNIFDSLLQKWPTETAFPETPAAQMPYSASFSSQASPVYSETYSNSPRETYSNSPRESYSEFQFWLGAPPASQHKASSLPLVYLNKGQFYPITLQGVNGGAGLANSKVKTVVMAVFENDKSPEMQLKCWNHWHGRQPTAKQRVIDIADYKEVFSGISSVEEVAFNALSFIWNPNQEAKVHIGINSLSTDFSSQKGVKGLPLNLQIDTYDFSSGSNRLLHRAACQVKVFCDKGAERKMRDEERKRSKRRGGKNVTDSSNSNSRSVVSSSVASESTLFGTLEDHVTQPVLFIPEMHLSSLQRCGLAPPSALVEEVEKSSLKRLYPDRDASPPCKQARSEETQRVLLYVRTETEEVFDALMLNTPNLTGLREAISEKYGMQKDTIGKIYKKCKRGIFVNMDDNIIQHYSNHSAFLLELSEGLGGPFHVTLMEL